MHPNTPAAAKAARYAIMAIVVSAAVTLIPPRWALYATAVMGCCAWIAAAWRPTGPVTGFIWGVLNALGANVGYAKNIPLPPLPPDATKI